MADATAEDHDQRLKVLLKEFFEQFVRCFWPQWADRLDFTGLVWLDKEVFLDPPDGSVQRLDLLARVRIQEGHAPSGEGGNELLAVLHVEVESQDRVKPLRARMFDYYVEARREYGLPVLPIGLYLRVGLDGVGWDSYVEQFWAEELLRFRYAYVGLPALPAEQYVLGPELVGVALSSLMKVTPERRAELHAEALKRIAVSGENDRRRFLLTECLEAYAELNDTDRARIEALLGTKPFREVEPLMITTYGRGKLDGRTEGEAKGRTEGRTEGQRETVLCFLESKFGSLPRDVADRVAALGALSAEQLRHFVLNISRASTLQDLHWPE